jgi:DNA-directed RNA polymerase specialized sigma24 family protein
VIYFYYDDEKKGGRNDEKINMKKKKLVRKNFKHKDKHYVNNEKLLQSLIVYKKNVKDWKAKGKINAKPPVDDYIGTCLLNIAKRFSYMPKFCNWPFVEEMVADSVENCLRYIDNFDPEKSTNPFSYFTQIIYYAFLRRIQKETKQQYIQYKMIEDMRTNCEDDEIKTMMNNFGTDDFNTHMDDFIANYEEYNENKPKRKRKEAKKENALDDLIEEETNV